MTIDITSTVILKRVNGNFVPTKDQKLIKVLEKPYKLKIIGEDSDANKMALANAKTIIKGKHPNYFKIGDKITTSVDYSLQK